MPLFAMISSYSMLSDSSKLCSLMLFLSCPVISAKSVKLLLFAILPCPFEHVIVISGDISVFMFCHALSVLHAHAFFSRWDAVAYCFDACYMPTYRVPAMCCYFHFVISFALFAWVLPYFLLIFGISLVKELCSLSLVIVCHAFVCHDKFL